MASNKNIVLEFDVVKYKDYCEEYNITIQKILTYLLHDLIVLEGDLTTINFTFNELNIPKEITKQILDNYYKNNLILSYDILPDNSSLGYNLDSLIVTSKKETSNRDSFIDFNEFIEVFPTKVKLRNGTFRPIRPTKPEGAMYSTLRKKYLKVIRSYSEHKKIVELSKLYVINQMKNQEFFPLLSSIINQRQWEMWDIYTEKQTPSDFSISDDINSEEM